MFGKLAEAKQKAEEVKARLSNLSVTGESASGKIRVIVSGNRKLLQIEVAEDFEGPQEELLLRIREAANQALEQADKVSEAEMAAIAQELMPGGLGMLGNLFGKK